jgi:DMSO reductase anchor subunit
LCETLFFANPDKMAARMLMSARHMGTAAPTTAVANAAAVTEASGKSHTHTHTHTLRERLKFTRPCLAFWVENSVHLLLSPQTTRRKNRNRSSLVLKSFLCCASAEMKRLLANFVFDALLYAERRVDYLLACV